MIERILFYNNSFKKYKLNYLISDNTSDSLRRVIKNIPNVIPN